MFAMPFKGLPTRPAPTNCHINVADTYRAVNDAGHAGTASLVPLHGSVARFSPSERGKKIPAHTIHTNSYETTRLPGHFDSTIAPLFYRPFVSTVFASLAFYYSAPQVWN